MLSRIPILSMTKGGKFESDLSNLFNGEDTSPDKSGPDLPRGGKIMRKNHLIFMCTAVLTLASLSSCGTNEIPVADIPSVGESLESTTEAANYTEADTGNKDDQEAADHVAELIDAIYVQKRTEDTDSQCAEAKEAWDALTDAQKELVSGENADPDYFGRDTGDASKDDPLNLDDIGENEILVVSFGTSFNDSRAEDIGGIEKALMKAYPDWSVRRAFTAQIIINHIQARDGVKIDNMEQALERAVDNGVKNLVIQPTHLMHGAEYDELSDAVKAYEDKFEKVVIAEPLLGQVGADSTSVNEDKKAVAEAITHEALKGAGYKDVKDASSDGTAFVFMGHGTSHAARVTYEQMQAQMDELSYDNVFIGTVEGEPESTACEKVIEKIKDAGYKKVILRPLMVVAGDHANNDMAGDDEDSWKSMFLASQAFDKVETQISGLGGIPDVQDLYVSHTGDAMDTLEISSDTINSEEIPEAPDDGVYEAVFTTDSSMFRVNESKDGKGELSVKDGEMCIHVSLVSKNITNLYVGTADKAECDSKHVLQPTEDTVTYSDGKSEVVYGFDIPVETLGEEFDLAILGKKGKWYDHKVKVVLA